MRRTARLLTGSALTAAAVGLVIVPAYGESAGRLEVLPASVAPGAQVTVNTVACGAGGFATGDATAVGAGTFTLAPSAPEKDMIGQFRVPTGAQPGTYEIAAKCSKGRQATVTGDLTVTLATATDQTGPRGSVKTGVGGALGADPVRTAAGVAVLAVAAAGGTWLLHRRARGDRI
ncbi:MAG: hypothetical protein LBV60_15835 [Streptomyces sp.]|jgi:hypothetical protein|nr:hypothetical protein [Streptomyces sp.]